MQQPGDRQDPSMYQHGTSAPAPFYGIPIPPYSTSPHAQYAAPAGPSPSFYGTPAAPYSMPSTSGDKSWGRGGPVGTGSIPLAQEAQVMQQFAERQVRNGFQRKVFGIVFIQLAITVAFSLVCLYVTPLKSYVRSTPWPFYLSCERLRRRWPVNMVLLGLFTLFQAFLVGMITSFFDIEAVMLAFLTTCVAVGILTFIAMQSKIDITHWGTYLTIPAAIFLVLVFFGIFWISRIVYLIIAGFSALLACVYLVYDLQLIMGGKNYAISPDEYVFIFIWTLALIGWGGRQ